MITLSILPNYLFFDNLLSFFKTNHSISWYPLTATLEIDGHIGIIWTPKQYLYNKFYFLHAQIYLLCKKNIISLTVRCHFTAQWHLHDRRWRPSWILSAILKECEHLNSVEHFLCLKHKIYYYHCLSQPFAAILRQKIGFQDSPWRPYWKMAAILKFAWPTFFSWRVTPIDYLYQICCLYHNLNDSSDICNYLLH